ncbi:MAG TPA: cation-translocating P-type ATPase [Cellulomonas sp.]
MTAQVAAPAVDQVAADEAVAWWRRIAPRDAARVAAVALCAALVAAGVDGPWAAVPALAVVGLVAGCWPVLTEAWEDLRDRRMTMELSMLLAIAAAAAIGEWVTALVITAFVLAAEILEDLSMDRGRAALSALAAFLPATVVVRDGDGVREVPLDELAVGQVVVVSPGGRVPVDGTVVAGTSAVDASRVTGESMPVELVPGDRVYAGSVNQVGVLEIAAERVGAASSYGQIVDAVRAAEESQAPAQRLADRLAGYLVYVALAAAAVTWLITRDLRATISVVIVAGACGVAAGTPLAVLGAIGRSARAGAIVKDGAHLEALSAVDTIVFDKTGTLTAGTPQVVAVEPAPGREADELLALAAGAEMFSEHPLGRAIVAEADARGLTVAQPESFDYVPGRGLEAQVAGHVVRVGASGHVAGARESHDDGTTTLVHVAWDDVYAGAIRLADAVRSSAAPAVADLQALGLRVVMLTGDRPATARGIGDRLGIEDVRAELLPTDKLAAVDALRAAGRRVAMVGDGVNDAPALAHADVGIAMGGGTDIARETGDVVLISGDLADLVTTVRTARRARRIVTVNFVGTVVVDLAGMALAAVGVLTPVLAAVVHVASESAFILNSARLAPGRARREATR